MQVCISWEEAVAKRDSDACLDAAARRQEFKAMRWLRLDLLRLWFVESWAPGTVDAAAAPAAARGRDEAGMEMPFRVVADLRNKLQTDQEVRVSMLE